ncbi:hypothetical protein [Pseudoxanthomonas composti]|uniref:Lectin n=1 Tax=Pseudoxanthomonas composti TaxID=2137479 RepID=A0A4Q1K0S5_9GAMM|nr:hypothetical protein [Pseudoxanthomonas composti]RXR08641.1 hypothetical protein EPA99_02130 [Pseudoxanthomonas composti]
MTSTTRRLVLTSALALALAACARQESPAPADAAAPPPGAAAEAAPAVQDSDPAATPPPTQAGAATPLELEGLGDLRIGQAPPAGWAARGAQESPACSTLSSEQHPGVYAMVLDGKVQRITVGQRSQVKLIEGIGVGASEADVGKWFAGFRETPHAYEAAPAKYLTAPNADSGGPALRFEIGQDGKVSAMHVGTMPALGYVEGCS